MVGKRVCDAFKFIVPVPCYEAFGDYEEACIEQFLSFFF
jgi:hypothetical protein